MDNKRKTTHTLMGNLFYPSILGSMFLLLICFVLNDNFLQNFNFSSRLNLQVLFGFYCIGIFSMSFWETYNLEVSKYSTGIFLLDWLEIIGILFLFYFLGFLPGHPSIDMKIFYLVLLLLMIPTIFWSYCNDYRRLPLPSSIQTLKILLFVIGLFYGEEYMFNLIVCIMLFTIYVVFLFWDKNYLWDNKLFIKEDNKTYTEFS